MLMRFRRAETKQFQHEQEVVRSGKGFWETHDLESWAKSVPRLEEHTTDFAIRMAEKPRPEPLIVGRWVPGKERCSRPVS